MNKDKYFTLQEASLRTVRWMCGIEVTDKSMCNELREGLGMDDVFTVMWQKKG